MTQPWYIAGLHFQCAQCGRCCSGPGEGYIWVVRPEIKLIADYLQIPEPDLRKQYLRRIGLRTSIVEHQQTKDCIFLKNIDGRKRCIIYPVRPAQCRNWPFWPENLKSPAAWNEAAKKGPGINRGRHYPCEQIQHLKKFQKWWHDDP